MKFFFPVTGCQIVAGKKSRFAAHKFAMLLKDINNKFDVSY